MDVKKDKKALARFTKVDANYIQDFLNESDKKVVGLLNTDNQYISYDPQGRVLFKAEIKNQDTYQVSYDVARNSNLQEGYYLWVRNSLAKQKCSAEDIDLLVDRLKALPSKGAIIPLQQELHHHLGLVKQLYVQALSVDKTKEETKTEEEIKTEIKTIIANVSEAHAYAMKEINKKFVAGAFAAALIAAKDEQTDEAFIQVINRVLDKRCKAFLPEAHDILLKYVQKTNTALKAETHFSSEAKIARKESAEKKTSTNMHLLHIDQKNQSVTRIEGSKYTAHDRREGTEFAHRSILTYDMPSGDSLQKKDRIWIRTPSLPVKKGLKENAYIADVNSKLAHIAEKYAITQPFTYNLLTALNSIRDGKNRQTQSTRHILLGAHQYNKNICEASGVHENKDASAQGTKGTVPICYVQAISVNGAGRALGYYSRIPFLRNGLGLRIDDQNEATLMAEMALMNNCCVGGDQNQFKTIQDQYQTFLNKESPTWLQKMLGTHSVYLFKTKEGQDIRKNIVDIKKSWRETSISSNLGTTTQDFSRFALQKMTAFDLHFSHDHAKLIQALSLHVEKTALFGCKSGNERTPIICERASVLDQKDVLITQTGLQTALKDAFNALCQATTKNDAKIAAKALNHELDRIYNLQRAYGASTMIPLVDQGAPPKIERKNGSIKSRIDTNYAEESGITSLSQSRAKAMQAHNDLVTYMHEAWDRWSSDVENKSAVHMSESDAIRVKNRSDSYTLIRYSFSSQNTQKGREGREGRKEKIVPASVIATEPAIASADPATNLTAQKKQIKNAEMGVVDGDETETPRTHSMSQ